jgi:predicted lipoprotein with Yx(FWY)xxD motif
LVPSAVLCLALAGCGTQAEDTARPDPTPSPAGSPAEMPSPTKRPSSPAPSTGTTVHTDDSEFGTMLFDTTGQAIYLFDKERTSRAECYDECAEAWPPVLTTGAPRAAGRVRAELLGTTRRTDGSTQVTYNGHPLYFYAHEGPGQVLCHNVSEYGGLWLVVMPNGQPAPR